MQRERSEFLGCVSPPFFVFYLTSTRELGSDCSSYGVSLCSTSYYPQKWGTNSRTAGRRAVSCGCCTGRGGTWPVWPPRRPPPCTKGPSRAPNCSVHPSHLQILFMPQANATLPVPGTTPRLQSDAGKGSRTLRALHQTLLAAQPPRAPVLVHRARQRLKSAASRHVGRGSRHTCWVPPCRGWLLRANNLLLVSLSPQKT